MPEQQTPGPLGMGFVSRANKGETMTETAAVKLEIKIIKLGKRIHIEKISLGELCLRFRNSGAWACTPQRHRTWHNWCKYAAPKMGMAFSTLASYGCPNHKRNRKEWLAKYANTRIHLNLWGKNAALLRKAIDHVRSLHGIDTNGTEAVCIMAEFYLSNARYSGRAIKKAA